MKFFSPLALCFFLLSAVTLKAQECCEDQLPEVVTTETVYFLDGNTVRIAGSVAESGSELISQRGIAWSSQPSPDVNDSVVEGGQSALFRADISGLGSGKTYYARAFATNDVGTAYGNQVVIEVDSFVTDIDGHAYTFVEMCGAKWTNANLAVKRYANGDTIPYVEDDSTWANTTSGAWCYHSNDPDNEAAYGILYNFYAVTDPRGLAPDGWHIPSAAEWNALSACYGGDTLSGGALKSNEMFWRQPNVGATDSSGFRGRPGGMRLSWGGFFRLGTNGHFWSTTVPFPGLVRYYALDQDNDDLGLAASGLRDGFSIRLVKD